MIGNGSDWPQTPWTLNLLSSLYKNGAVTPEEVVLEAIRRAQEDEAYAVWITPPDLERIRPYLDRLKGTEPDSLPLWGIPFAVKDNIDVAGWPTTAACPAFAYTPDVHAEAVARLVAAGAIPIGKTNLDQFATGLVGSRSPYGETRNALKPELISGGSSGGSAVAVARSQAVFALGTDTAGSGRVPAALNGLVGYKPSLGAWPVKGLVPACASLDCITVFAYELGDAYEVDAVIRGFCEADPWSRQVPAPRPALPAKLLVPADVPGFYGSYAAEYESAWHRAVERLRGLGLPVETVDTALFAEAAAILYEGPWVAERWADLGAFVEAHPGGIYPVTERVLRTGASPDYDAASVFRAMHRLQELKREARRLLDGAVLVLPTAGGTWTRDQVRENPVGANRDMGRYTNHCNLLDQCAVAVPAGWAAEGVPFGITLFASWDREDLIRGTAERYLSQLPAAPGAGLAEAESAATAQAGEGAPSTRSDLAEADPSTAPSNPAASALAASAPAALDPIASAAVPLTLVAVCGLHMRGFPLERQMREFGARFLREDSTAPRYRLLRLPTAPAKPGLVKVPEGGASISLEVWEMPLDGFGGFAALIPAPLGIGKVELADGTEVPGFICEGYAANTAEDVTVFGGWRNVPAQS